MGLLPKLCAMVADAAANPSKPNFNHALFEAVASVVADVVKHAKAADAPTTGDENAKQACRRIEALVFPTFQLVLQQDVQEFAPYVFQIMALLLEANRPVRGDAANSAATSTADSAIPEVYLALFPVLLSPTLWERQGNVPALVRLLEAYLTRGALDKAAAQLQGVLGVFQKLIASKAHDHEGFYILNAVTASLEHATLEPFLGQVWQILFMRLQTSSTIKFQKAFVVYFCLVCLRYGPEALHRSIEGVQAGLFAQLLTSVIVPTATMHVSGDSECTLCCAALMQLSMQCTKLLCDVNAFGGVLGAAVALAERGGGGGASTGGAGPSTAPAGAVEDDEASGAGAAEYGVAFATLLYARRDAANAPIERLIAAVGNPGAHVATSLGALHRSHPQLVTSTTLAQLVPNPNLRERLGEWLTKAGVAIA